jgi:hypothetical protein
MLLSRHTRRREFIKLLGGGAMTGLPINFRTAQAVGPAHIGFITGLDESAAADFLNALRDGLAARGYTEPSTLKIRN